MEADLGGSEILEPLQAVFELPTIEGYVRQVFVITDGLVRHLNYVKSMNPFVFIESIYQ